MLVIYKHVPLHKEKEVNIPLICCRLSGSEPGAPMQCAATRRVHMHPTRSGEYNDDVSPHVFFTTPDPTSINPLRHPENLAVRLR